MKEAAPKLRFDACQIKMGLEWYVRVTLLHGETRHLGGFKSEAEANEWIKRESAGWLKGHERGRYV